MNPYKKRRKEELKKRAQKDDMHGNISGLSKTDFYEMAERLATKIRGILFIVHRHLDNDNPQAVARDDAKQSAVFDFNLASPAGLSMLCECEKVLSDQNMSLEFWDTTNGTVIWFGGSLDESGEKYLNSSYGDGAHSAPVTQNQLVSRVNRALDLCSKYIQTSIEQDKRVYVNASNRMNGYLNYTKLGKYVIEKYPEIFHEGKDD